MDISKLSLGAKLVLGATVAFLVFSFFNWQEVEFAGIATAGVSMWHGVGVVAGIIAIGLLAWEALKLLDVKIEVGLTPTMVTAGLAILLLVFTFIKFLVDNEFRTFWAWLGLLLAIAVVVGAVLEMQAAGESFSDMRTSLSSVAAGAGERSSRTTTGTESVPPAPPVSPSTPATPPAPEPEAPPAEAEAPGAPQPPEEPHRPAS